MLRIMICDDTPGYAVALQRLLEHDGDITVLACGANADEAIAMLDGAAIDLIAIDAGLPDMTGLAAVEEIMSSHPTPVLMLMPAMGGTREQTGAALAAGAVAVIGRDKINTGDPAGQDGSAFRDRVRLLARAPVIRHPRARLRRPLAGPGIGRRAAAIGFCASTGGPKVLAGLLAALPAGYPIPLLVVQHISAGFTDGLVRWLDHAARVPVRVAEHGARASSGAWIAPEDADLRLGASGRLELDASESAGHHRPSGDALLTSVATVAGPAGVAVVLSGMGTDGAQGAAAVRRAGGFAIAQDERSSAVYGMPKAAAERGVNVVLSPAEIASYLTGLSYQPLAGRP